jgi:hypothetical protein
MHSQSKALQHGINHAKLLFRNFVQSEESSLYDCLKAYEQLHQHTA